MATELSIQQIIDEDFFDQAECGVYLKKTPRTLERWEQLGIGPPVTMIRKKRFYEKREVYAWERKRKKRVQRIAPVRRGGAR